MGGIIRVNIYLHWHQMSTISHGYNASIIGLTSALLHTLHFLIVSHYSQHGDLYFTQQYFTIYFLGRRHGILH